MFGNEGHGHIPHTSTAAFFYPKLPAMNFSRLFGAVPVLTRGKSQNFHCLLFYLLIHIYIYTKDSQTSPSRLWLGLEEKGPKLVWGSFGLFCGCGSPFLLQTSFLFFSAFSILLLILLPVLSCLFLCREGE